MYRAKTKRPQHFDYDLIVIGSGSGGGVAANLSAKYGKRVAIIEAGKVGGECPNYGCVPTKALLSAAETYKNAKQASRFGIRTTGVSFNYKTIKAWKDQAVHNTGTHEGADAFKKSGVKLIKGHAHFLDKWTVSIGSERLTAKKFLIAAGTYNFVPPIEGLKETGFITYKQAIDLEKLPTSIFIIGGGAIGCEFAYIFNAFGSRVQIAEVAPRLASKEDPEVGIMLSKIFEDEGIAVNTNVKIIKVSSRAGRKEVVYEVDGQSKRTVVDEILVATGKKAMTDIGLENAGVRYNSHSIATNRQMRTNVKHIYAAGDVTGPYMFTHMASYQSRIAAHNMWHRSKVYANYHAVPRCIFTNPEVASVGMTEAELKENGIAYQKAIAPTAIIGRSNVTQEYNGFVKVLASDMGVILGASIIAPRAGEMIHELALAVHKGLKARDIDHTIHAFPTWSEAVRIACSRIINT